MATTVTSAGRIVNDVKALLDSTAVKDLFVIAEKIVRYGENEDETEEATYEQRLHLLIHELLHGAAEMLKHAGVISRQPDEAFITNAAGPLLYALGVNGLLRGVDRDLIRHSALAGVRQEQGTKEGK